MDNTEKAISAYALPATAIVHRTSAGFNTRTFNPPVHLMQYDNTLPVIAVSLRSGEAGELPYTVPQGAQINVRMDKADGHHVYNPALGLDSARQTVYIGVTAQMTACAGLGTAVVEVVLNGGVAGAAPVALDIAENPVPEAAITSSDEFLSIAEMVAQAAASAAAAAKSASDAQNSKTAAAGSASAAQNSEAAAQAAADNANESKSSAFQSASAAQNSANAASGSASDAAASAALAAQHANPITDATVNDAGNLILTLSSGNEVDAGHVEGPQGIQGIQGPAGRSAYETAAAGGYTGTQEAFSGELAGLPELYKRPSPGILINGDFRCPVNQRGQTVYSGGYTIDMWSLYETKGNLSLDNEGAVSALSLNAGYGNFIQKIENYTQYIGKTLTLSLLAENVNGNDMVIALNDGKIQIGASIKNGLVSASMTVSANATNLYVKIQNNSQTDGDIQSLKPVAVKLELGSRQTLAHQEAGGGWVLNDPPPNPALELMKCQRYQVVYKGFDWMTMVSTGVVNAAADGLYLPLTLPVPLRAAPAISYNDIQLFEVYQGNRYVPKDITVYAKAGTAGGISAVTLRCDVSELSEVKSFTTWQLAIKNGGQMILDANL